MLTLFRSLFAPPRHLILVLAALWIGLTLSEKRVARHGISKDSLNNLVYYSILGFILGGRILFALANLPAFAQNPLNIFSLNIDLFDPFGALMTALLVAFVYGQRQKLPLWATLDASPHCSRPWQLAYPSPTSLPGPRSDIQPTYSGESNSGMLPAILLKFMNWLPHSSSSDGSGTVDLNLLLVPVSSFSLH